MYTLYITLYTVDPRRRAMVRAAPRSAAFEPHLTRAHRVTTAPEAHPSSHPSPKMSCCRIFLQRAPHAPKLPLSSLTRGSLRIHPLSPKPRLIRSFSATRLRLSSLPPSHRQASKDLYPAPDKSKRYRMFIFGLFSSCDRKRLTRRQFSLIRSSSTTPGRAGSSTWPS